MNVERLLQISIATLAALGTLLLGLGQSDALLPLLALSAAGGSLYLTDIKGVVRLNRNVATLAAIAAVCIAMIQFAKFGHETQLLAIANLLIYLQIVLLFQAKEVRIYWQLIMLSLLQVVVAAALSFSLAFGLLMVLYLFVGLATMTLFFIYREAVEFGAALPAAQPGPGLLRRGRELLRSGFLPRCRENWLQLHVGRDVARQVFGQGLLTLLLTGALFFLVPRFAATSLIQSALSGPTTIGFSETVELGRLGEVLEDRASVMRVWFTKENGEPYLIAGEPLFRGAIVDTYVNREGRGRRGWQLTYFQDSQVRSARVDPQELEPGKSGDVLEKISLEAQSEPTVFSVYPALKWDNPCPVEWDIRKQQLIRKNFKSHLDTTLSTSGLDAQGHQADVLPADRLLTFNERAILVAMPERDNAGRDPLTQLRQFAATVVADSKLPESDRMGRARAMEKALRESSRFEYSLAPQTRDQDLDPMEDFISLHPRGHCEYFSSALTLMLRSQGIPARMVIGYKGGEFNSLGNYYQVRKLHAHTWVEAYLDSDAAPSSLGGHRWRGAWLRLDPTPASADASGRELTLAERTRDWLDYCDYLWTNYVVGLDAKRQQEVIFAPFAFVIAAVKEICMPTTWTHTLPWAFSKVFSLESLRWLRDNWLSWPFASCAALLGVLGYGILRINRKLWRGLNRRKAQRPAQRRRRQLQARPPVPFYQQLESLLLRHGIRRPESQTQHEFAMAIGGQFVESPRLSAAAWLPRRIVDAFYRVRFGQHALDKSETDAVQQALHDLAAALQSAPAGRAT